MTTKEEKQLLPCNTAIAESPECKVITASGEEYTIPKDIELKMASKALRKPIYSR